MTMTTPKPPKPPRARPRRGILGLPADPRLAELPEGALPCRSCGVAVQNPEPSRANVGTAPVYVPEPTARLLLGQGHPLPSAEVPLTRCDDCTERQVLAATLLDAHPRVRAANGNVGVDRLDAALAALDLIGFRGDHDTMIETLTASDVALHETIERLSPTGAAASWSLRAVERDGTCAVGRWGHVGSDLAQSAVAASRALFLRQFESPALVPPPADGAPACLLCGLGHLRARPSDRERAWGRRFDWDVSHLGGRPRAERAVGYLCPADRAALRDNDGAIGVAVIERALLTHLGYTLMMGAHFTRDLGRAWITLAPGSEPNAEPWAHLNLARIRRSLDGSPWVRRVPGSEPR